MATPKRSPHHEENNDTEHRPDKLPVWEQDGDGDPVVTTKYNPASFIVPGSDHQGHSERVWCRVQPLVERQVDVILRSKKFPFRTKGDVIRWCVVNGLRQLEAMEPSNKGFMAQIAVIDEIMATEMRYHDFFASFRTMEEVIGKHMSSGALGEARRMLAIIKAEVLAMNDSPYWQKKCLDEIRAKFGNILDMDKG